MGEKPMAENRTQALNEIAVSNKTGKSYSVMQNRIYFPGMRTIRKALSEKKIGEGYTIYSDFFIGAHFGGFRDYMDNPLILDMAVHTFYQARFLMNANPISVYCHEFNPKGSWYKGNASAIAIFEFEGGGLYEYRGSWCSEGFNTTWECDWRIIGSHGTIKWDGANKPVMQTTDENESRFIRSAKTTELEFDYHSKNVGQRGKQRNLPSRNKCKGKRLHNRPLLGIMGTIQARKAVQLHPFTLILAFPAELHCYGNTAQFYFI